MVVMCSTCRSFAVAKFHDVAQDGDHQVLGLFLFVNLVGDDVLQTPLLGVEQNGVVHPLSDDLCVKGTSHEIGYAQLVSPADDGGDGLGRDDNHGQVIDPVILVHVSQNAEAVQLRHDDIQQHQSELLGALLQNGHSFPAVFRLHNVIVFRQHIRKQHPVDGSVVNDQDFKFLRGSFHDKNSSRPYSIYNYT